MPTVTISANTGADYAGLRHSNLTEGLPNFASFSGTLAVHTYGSGDRSNSLLDVSDGLAEFKLDVADPVTVSVAGFRLNCSFSAGGTKTIDAHRLLRAFVEAEGTWNEYSAGNAWATAGATGTGDINATASASIAAPLVTGLFEITSEQLAADLQAAINSDGIARFLLKAQQYTEYGGEYVYEFTGNNGTDGLKPELFFTYSLEGASFSAAWAAGSNQQVIQ